MTLYLLIRAQSSMWLETGIDREAGFLCGRHLSTIERVDDDSVVRSCIRSPVVEGVRKYTPVIWQYWVYVV